MCLSLLRVAGHQQQKNVCDRRAVPAVFSVVPRCGEVGDLDDNRAHLLHIRLPPVPRRGGCCGPRALESPEPAGTKARREGSEFVTLAEAARGKQAVLPADGRTDNAAFVLAGTASATNSNITVNPISGPERVLYPLRLDQHVLGCCRL